MVPSTVLDELVIRVAALTLVPARDVLKLVVWIPIWSACHGACIGSIVAVCAHLTSMGSEHAVHRLLHPYFMNTLLIVPPLTLTVGVVSFGVAAGQKLFSVVQQHKQLEAAIALQLASGSTINAYTAGRLVSRSCSTGTVTLRLSACWGGAGFTSLSSFLYWRLPSYR